MKKFVRIIDDNGIFLRDAFVDVDEIDEKTIEAPCPAGFHKPKWDGEKWVEGGEAPVLSEQKYVQRVVDLVREKYSADDEFAILRKKTAGIDDGEFDIYNAYVESCKTTARNEFGL